MQLVLRDKSHFRSNGFLLKKLWFLTLDLLPAILAAGTLTLISLSRLLHLITYSPAVVISRWLKLSTFQRPSYSSGSLER
jgi:hypothetical protein